MAKLTQSARSFSELLIEVFRINGLALVAGDVLAGPSQLTSARWQVLGVVDHAPASAAEVARAMGLARQSVQLTADALERDGFIDYRANPKHRRAKLIAITEAGRMALRAVEARHATWAGRIARSLDATALAGAVTTLRNARELLEREQGERR